VKVYARIYGALAPTLAALAAVLPLASLVGPPCLAQAGRPRPSGAAARRRIRHGARAARTAAARRTRIRKRKG